MSTDAERLAALLDDALYRDEGIWRAAGKADTDAIAARLTEAGVGFPAEGSLPLLTQRPAPDEGLDVEAAYTAAHVTVTGDSIHTTTLIRSPSEEAAWKAGYEYARLQSEAPAPEDV